MKKGQYFRVHCLSTRGVFPFLLGVDEGVLVFLSYFRFCIVFWDSEYLE